MNVSARIPYVLCVRLKQLIALSLSHIISCTQDMRPVWELVATKLPSVYKVCLRVRPLSQAQTELESSECSVCVS